VRNLLALQFEWRNMTLYTDLT
jgi:hypothetical protein